ncbi:MAG: hypothetical protein M3174_07415 [Actinomycetota bacterium]|nr:hypothetical protein [Actinomycetota bacterium]
MPGRKQTRARTCERKRRYATSGEAESTAAHRRAESGEQDLDVYPCRYCGGWHIGHTPPARRGRL